MAPLVFNYEKELRGTRGTKKKSKGAEVFFADLLLLTT